MLSQPLVPAGLRPILVGSAVGHVVLIVAFALGTILFNRRDTSRPEHAIITKLVKLGKKRDEKLLPRLTAPPPGDKAVALPTPEASADGKSLQAATDRLKQASQVSSALDRLKQKNEPEEGHPDGVAEGEVTDLDKAIMGSKFTTEVHRCMKAHFNVEGVPPERVRGRQATILVRARRDGTLSGTLESSSGLSIVDDSVLLAVKRCGKVSPPPRDIADLVATDGILIEFIP